jgi:hypothetical protein
MEKLTREDMKKLPYRFQVLMAVFCAKQVISLVREEDKAACLHAIDMAEKWVRGEASAEHCRDAANVAHAAAAAAAAAAANAAAYAANAAANAATAATAAANAANATHAAAYAANAADRAVILKAQHAYYNELLNFDAIANKALLGL